MFKKILLFFPALFLSAAVFAQSSKTPDAPTITPASKDCFQKFVKLRTDALKNLQEMYRLQDEMEKKAQIKKILPSWQIKQINLQREHSLKSLGILQEITNDELDEKSCNSLIERLELSAELTELSKGLFEALPDDDFTLPE